MEKRLERVRENEEAGERGRKEEETIKKGREGA
jgi:hypothetical protein